MRLKEEQLDVYLKAEIEYEARIEEGEVPAGATPIGGVMRRVQHSVELARRCVALEKARLDLVRQNEALGGRVEELERKVEEKGRELSSIEQPTKYVVERLNATERENLELAKTNKLILGEMAELKTEMHEVLVQRGELGSALEAVKFGVGVGVGMGMGSTNVWASTTDMNDGGPEEVSIHVTRAEESPNRSATQAAAWHNSGEGGQGQ